MVKKIWKDQFELMVKEKTGIIAREDIDGAVDMLVIDKIDPQVFISNLEVLMRGYISPFNFSGVESKEPSPSAQYSDITRRAPAFPLWFYAAYPDVMKWFHEWQKEYARSIKFDDDQLITETMKLFGVKAEDINNNENLVLNKERQYRPEYLKNLVQKYKERTEKVLEAMVGEYSEGDIYTGQKILESVGSESNFTFIAENTTKFYLELERKYREVFKNKTSLFAAAGIIDAAGYIQLGQISPQEIVDLASGLNKNGEPSLTDFLIELEIKLFEVDTPEMTSEAIRRACEEQRENIEKAIQKTEKQYTGEPQFACAVENFMKSKQHREIRNLICVKNENELISSNSPYAEIPKRKAFLKKIFRGVGTGGLVAVGGFLYISFTILQFLFVAFAGLSMIGLAISLFSEGSIIW